MAPISPIAAGALRVGEGIVRGAKIFSKGVTSSLNFGKDTINRTASKINASNQRIRTQRKKQTELTRRENETKDKTERETKVEARRQKRGGSGLIRKAIAKPVNSLLKLIAAWAIANLPTIIKEITKFVKKVRIFSAAVKNAVTNVGTVFKGLVNIAKAFIQNLKEFDFNDASGRIQTARAELDEGVEEIQTSFDEAQNVWGRDEEELDSILESLESGDLFSQAVAAVDAGFDNAEAPTIEPQNTAVGPGSRTSSSTGWGPILELIAKAESRSGSYDSIYPNSIKPGLSKMTIGEADAWQEATASQRGSAAAGRYQFMYIKDQAALAGLGPNDIFSPENQDKMAIALIEKKKKITLDMLENDPVTAARKLAEEWAGLPVLSQTRGAKRTVSRGQSYYAGDGRNKANATTGEVEAAMAQTLAGNSQPQEAVPAGESTMDLIAKIPFEDMSKTASEGGRGPVGKTDVFDPGGTINTRGRPHLGVDIGTSGQRGWYVALKLNGTVTYVGTQGTAGKMVIIESGGKEYVFMHLANYKVSSGQKYSAGKPIGEIGNTGRSTGIHLHFEVRVNNKHIDPHPYMKLLEIGKMRVRTASSSNNTSGTSESRARETSQVASSVRTNQNTSQTVLLKQTEVVMVG